jgi:hypothetical protein
MGRREPGGMVGCVEETVVGSQGVREGVRRVFRFWVIESSIVLRERRRKSGRELVLVNQYVNPR